MPKYAFTKKNAAGEEFRAEGCDSFDEAVRKVEKGISERDVELAEQARKDAPPALAAAATEVSPAKPGMVEAYDAEGTVIPGAAPATKAAPSK